MDQRVAPPTSMYSMKRTSAGACLPNSITQPRLRGEEANEARQVAPQERLASREADLVHSEGHEDVGERADLLEVEDLLARKPDVLLLGHAVLAAQVASVGDRDAEVPQRTTVRVVDPHQAAPLVTGSSA